MNLLAHAVLSPADPEILVGNVTADWVKGRARLALPPQIRIGMQLHHAIDAFTDTHPLVDACTTLLAERWGRYAPVLVDIFFDHVLSCDWTHCCVAERSQFIGDVYRTLRIHQHLLPARAQYAVNALLADNWFSCYASLDGIALSLTRLSVRLNHGIELAPAVEDFRRHREAFHQVFHAFFPELRRHVMTEAEAQASPA